MEAKSVGPETNHAMSEVDSSYLDLKLLPTRANEARVLYNIDVPLLQLVAPSTPMGELKAWVTPMQEACRIFGIDTIREVASWLANGSHESKGFQDLEENLNYSAKRLCQVWPSRFPTLASAQPYAHNPQALANKVYASRMGNGPPESGDGWRHRGLGIFQLTGLRNQSLFGQAVGLSLSEVPTYLLTKEGAALSAGWYWWENSLDIKAATPGVEDDRRAINGGLLGVDEVRRMFNKVVQALLARGL